MNWMKKIGFTTTVPVEAILAAGMVPVDLNNVFIASDDPAGMVEQAEAEGLPRTTCGWIKGLYVAASELGIDTVIGVTQGDCSNTHALMELWTSGGIRTIPFAYPYDRDQDLLRLQVRKLMDALGTTEEATRRVFEDLRPLRASLRRLDEMTWRDGLVTGGENHLRLVSSSDFNGDPDLFHRSLLSFMEEAEARGGGRDEGMVRVGYIGVPPIFSDLYETVEAAGGMVVFNETQRQFSMPYDAPDIYEQYARYTYPYDVFGRIADINEQVAVRGLDCIIHYCQSFCFRAIEDLIIRREVALPVLTIEGDRPGPVDARTKIRLEGFIEMVRDRKARN